MFQVSGVVGGSGAIRVLPWRSGRAANLLFQWQVGLIATAGRREGCGGVRQGIFPGENTATEIVATRLLCCFIQYPHGFLENDINWKINASFDILNY